MGATAIPVDELITLIQSFEAAYSSKTPRDVLTELRCLYYGGVKFHQLLPEGIRFGTGVDKVPPNVLNRLREHADENGTGDNPSPYFVSKGDDIDLGHVVLGLEALLSDSCSVPFIQYGVPRLDPASWIADVAIACVWDKDGSAKPHEDGWQAIDAHAKAFRSKGDAEPFFLCSAPRPDLLGDVDLFGLHVEWDGIRKVSDVFKNYYQGAGLSQRWVRFASHAKNSWAMGASASAAVEDRVNRMAQLYADGSWEAGAKTVAWSLVPFGNKIAPLVGPPIFPKTKAYVARFMAWVAKQGAGDP